MDRASSADASAAATEWPNSVRIHELIIANRILADQDILDSFGHVSVRSAEDPYHYFMSRSRAPGLVTAEDIMEFDLESTPLDSRGHRVYGERYIHSRIYKARPDIHAVVHTHSQRILPFSISDIPMQPVIHMAGFLKPETPVFDIRDAPGRLFQHLLCTKPC